ncbi:MAG: T9SS type A sorting domain-containing protein, partial [Bacteroidota bacterium]|nr:T9SS type A sorting domain-containing protein [Bacteroidota bacterium]
RVSRAPIWNDGGTYVDPETICMGEEVLMCASYSTETVTSTYFSDTILENNETMYLPDGSGVCYETSIIQNQFIPGQTIENASDIVGICMNLEHSYLNDLTMYIQCPSGQSIQLETQGGGSTHLGEPIDPGTGPGIGYDYCFTPDAMQTLEEAASGVSTVPAGDYAPYESFDNLIGCPLNGEWTISVCDNWAIDDGYIFGWYIEFYESFYYEEWSYTPQYTPTEWYGLYGSEMDEPTDQNCATGTYLTTDNPTENTQQPFVFILTDDFGCVHDTSLYVTVENQSACCYTPDPDAGMNGFVCGPSTTLDGSNPAGGNDAYWEQVSGPGTVSFTDETNPTTNVNVDIYGEYEFAWIEEYEGNPLCVGSDTVDFSFYEMLDPTITPIPDMCVSDAPVQLEIVSEGTITTSPNIDTLIANGIIDPQELSPGIYTITNGVSGTCMLNDQSQITFEVFDIIEISSFYDQNCINENSEFVVEWTTVGGECFPTSDYNVNGYPQSSPDYHDTIPSAGYYSYTVTDNNGCSNIVLEGYRDCDCPSPGTMTSLELVTLCEGDCTGGSVFHNEDSIMLDTSQFEFFIHAGDGIPLAYNSEPDFCLPGFGGAFNQVYYVSAVSGYDENSDGHVTYSDSCYAITQGTPVKWLQTPVVDAGQDHDTCGLVLPFNGSNVPAGMLGYWTSSCNFAAVQGTDYHDPDMVAMVEDYGDCTFTWHVVNDQCSAEDDVVMHFNQDPDVDAGNDTAVCGNQIELSVEHSLPGTTFQWDGSANFDTDTSASTIITVNTLGTYGFTVTEYNGSCYSQDEVMVTFLLTPQPVIQNPVDTVCGIIYNLSVQNVTGEGHWTAYEDGIQVYPFFENITSPNTQVVIDGITGTFRTIEFVWTETNAYIGVECSDSVSCNITFGNNVYAFAGSDSETCGIEGSLDADTIGFGTDISGSWWLPDVPGMFIPAANAPDATYRLTSMISFGDSAHVTVPFVWEVTNGACVDLDTAYITFYEAPEAYAGQDDVSCGMNYQLSAYYTLPPTTSYTPSVQWSSLPDNPSSADFIDSSIPNAMVNVEEAGEYGFVWRENNSLLTSCNDRDTVWIEFKNKPIANAGNDTIFCDLIGGLEAEPNSPPSTGIWLYNSDKITLTDSTDPFTVIISDVYTEGNPDYDHFALIWTETLDGCTGADTIYVGFDSMPDPLNDVIQVPSDSILQNGETGTLNVDNSVPYYKYWVTKESVVYSDTIIGTGDNIILGTNFVAGAYECWISSISGCMPGDPYPVSFIDGSGISTQNATQWYIYPNPAKDRLFIISNKQIEFLEIINLQGKSVFSVQDNVQKIDISMLNAGMYFVKIQTAECLSVKRFVKK